MTAQVPDRLRNNHPRLDFGDLRLFGLVRTHPNETHPWDGVIGPTFDYPRAPQPRGGGYSTACYRGYVASFALNVDGTLTLLQYEYTTYEPAVIDGKNSVSINVIEDSVGQDIAGDFWLVLRPHFYRDPTTFVPFRDGHIIEDQSEWIVVT